MKKDGKLKSNVKYFFIPIFEGEVMASLRLPKEIEAESKKVALIKAKELGRGLFCKVIKEI